MTNRNIKIEEFFMEDANGNYKLIPSQDNNLVEAIRKLKNERNHYKKKYRENKITRKIAEGKLEDIFDICTKTSRAGFVLADDVISIIERFG